ncbi:hypothetical protein BDV26DRAFT_277091 [Aspergillus bertholletiae]|uniref:Uncharacterized protein n=1 Tax=Aspergillus bertholletiae TaxID=1226010 RepID=A0A5N7BPU6_9EURO|nr:hypothetical protein BDV26DRAFT_277091 [Aspergillus bertholletiae]
MYGACSLNTLTAANYTSFVSNHTGTVSPPDVRTYKGFMEFLGRNLKGRLSKGKAPVLNTLDGMRRDLDTGLTRQWGYYIPEHVSTTIREVNGFSRNNLRIVQKYLCILILLYCFTSARTARKHRGTEAEKNINTAVMAAYYKYFHLSIEWVGDKIMLEGDYKLIDIVHFKPEILNTPVIRPRDEGADAFGKMFAALGHWADKNHSETALAEVDGVALFLGIVSRRDHIENNRSMGARPKEELKFQDYKDIVRLDTEI